MLINISQDVPHISDAEVMKWDSCGKRCLGGLGGQGRGVEKHKVEGMETVEGHSKRRTVKGRKWKRN